jgi:hypothetical protein
MDITLAGQRCSGLVVLIFFLMSAVSSQLRSEDWIYRLHEGENLTLVKEWFLKPEFTAEQLQIYNGIERDREIPIGTEVRVPIDWMKDELAGVQVSSVYGEASMTRRGADETIAISVGDILKAGDRIHTGPKSAVSLKFADQSVLLVGESSEVLFDALSSYQGVGMLDTRMRLQHGRVENRVTPFKRSESRYEIHTPSAVAVVRGTDFRVSSDIDDAETRNEVSNGEVEVIAQGVSVSLKAGEGALVKSGEAPSEPRKLLPAPNMSQLSLVKHKDQLLLEWPELAAAVGYRYQLKDHDQVLLSTGVVQANQVAIQRLSTEEYHLYLRGIDALGFEGMEGQKAFHRDVEAPRKMTKSSVVLRMTPELKAPQFLSSGVAFEWTAVADAWAYRFILALDEGLNDILFERISFDHGFQMYPPGPGRYFVAVEALVEDGVEKSLSNIMVLEFSVWQ